MVRNPQAVEGEDPCPDLPTSFRTAEHVAKIAGKPAPRVAPPDLAAPERVIYAGPKRVLRTALSSMACSDRFGPMMQREAQRRRFYQAPLGAFLGDGLPWNWTIWKRCFATFVPILDFIHAIEYLFAAAWAMSDSETAAWDAYLVMVTQCWQGQVDEVIAQLTVACQSRGVDLKQRISEDDPCKPLADAARYFSNNCGRMDYPRYRRLGLPVTSAPMESLIKQINHRVKGTEMFWDDPHGAEVILQLRAAALSEDDRLDSYLSRRPGCAYVRRPPPQQIAA
jgi:hypothetical protein